MRTGFMIGLTIGFIGGSLLVANNYKAKQMVSQAQNKVMTKVQQKKDEMQQNMCETSIHQSEMQQSDSSGQIDYVN